MIIIPATDRATENEVALAIVALLRTRAYGEADMKTIMFHLPSFIRLSTADRELSRSRPNEQRWHAVLRNIAAHEGQPNNAIHDGVLVRRRGGGYQLASKARKAG
jgi:hypothetical protein